MPRKVSSATIYNFVKLDKNINNHEFLSRANKQDSTKQIIPLEYYSNKDNVTLIDRLVNKAKRRDVKKAISSYIISMLLQDGIIKVKNGIFESEYKYVNQFVNTLEYYTDLIREDLPNDERDSLGIIYQELITEGEKNQKGSYYTPKKIAKELLNVNSDSKKTFCDPCCGTGGFLIEALSVFNPENIYGYDIDPIAVLIAKANLFRRYPSVDFNERILNNDFLYENNNCFDYIITNPPWGNIEKNGSIPLFTSISSGEMFSYFLEHSLSMLNEKGMVNFLLPVSLLNVLLHKDIREFILNNFRIIEVKEYGKCFKGVLTDVISLKISKDFLEDYSYIVIDAGGKESVCPISLVKNNRNKNILLLNKTDCEILTKIESKKALDLKDAQFALGIVTGDNKNKIKKTNYEGKLEPILTGKDINKYYLSDASNYIEYDRSKFQQVCADEYFRANPKFLYKFISKKLIFSLDTNKNLALNSSNIMILNDNYPLSSFAVLAILNSDVMNYFFIKVINQIKVLKNDIQNLPIPMIPQSIQNEIEKIVKDIIKSKNPSKIPKVEKIIYDYYDLNEDEIKYIRKVVYGKTKNAVR